MGLPELLVAGAYGLLEVTGIMSRIRGYLSPQRRTQRALLFVELAKDVLALIKMQKGVSEPTAEVIDAAINLLVERLVHEGVKPANARPLAERLIAGAIERSKASQ